jgi:hypothetical protein
MSCSGNCGGAAARAATMVMTIPRRRPVRAGGRQLSSRRSQSRPHSPGRRSSQATGAPGSRAVLSAGPRVPSFTRRAACGSTRHRTETPGPSGSSGRATRCGSARQGPGRGWKCWIVRAIASDTRPAPGTTCFQCVPRSRRRRTRRPSAPTARQTSVSTPPAPAPGVMVFSAGSAIRIVTKLTCRSPTAARRSPAMVESHDHRAWRNTPRASLDGICRVRRLPGSDAGDRHLSGKHRSAEE